jgi:coenzyme F420-0:L-glutamate ligase/coenzyme F420-1:gamma-L-glutamate ligase
MAGLAEEVLGGVPLEGGGAGAVAVGDQVGDAADPHRGDPARLVADEVLLLPADPDASARRLRAEIAAACGARPAVIVGDSFGRPWRVGQTEVAIGCAGLDPLDDWRGRTDRDGRELAATSIATADQLAAAADLVRDKASGIPAVRIRGFSHLVTDGDGPGAAALQRNPAEDLFR